MTKDEILNMPAGRRMDALIATEIMKLNLKHLPVVYEEGNTSDGKDGWSGFVCPRCRYPDDMLDGPCCQNYSENIFFTWEMVEKLQKTVHSISIEYSIESNPIWSCVIIVEYDDDNQWYVGEGDTPSLAICRAALLTTFEGEQDE